MTETSLVMLELITNLIWVTIGIICSLAVVYSLVRLAAIAWHRTKAEFDTPPHEDEEHPELEHPELEHPEREHPK